jgi:hypothetical protein
VQQRDLDADISFSIDSPPPAVKERLNFRPPPFEWTGPLRPAYVTPKRHVPDHIKKPDYATTGEPLGENGHTIHINTPAEIKGMRVACRLGREVLDLAHRSIRVGITTDEIDEIVHNFIIANDAYPSPLNYKFFPKSCCTSPNEVVSWTHRDHSQMSSRVTEWLVRIMMIGIAAPVLAKWR